MKEILDHYMPKIEASTIVKDLGLKTKDFFVVSAHREENIDSEKNFNDLLESLNEIVKIYNKRVIVSTHPRTMKKLIELDKINSNNQVEFMKPMGLFDYVKLQMEAYCVISDSGTITEESSILNFPAITIRQAHERPEGMDEGTLIMSGLNKERVLQSIEVITSQHLEKGRIQSVCFTSDSSLIDNK